MSLKDCVKNITQEIWAITGYRFTSVTSVYIHDLQIASNWNNYSVKDHKTSPQGHSTRYFCSQDAGRKKAAKPSVKPGVVHRHHEGMPRFDCNSSLRVSIQTPPRQPETCIVTVRLSHDVRHVHYYDVALPDGAAEIIRHSIEYSLPSQLVPEVQATYPNVSPKQVHRAWSTMSQIMWRRAKNQLESAKKLMEEFGEDVKVLDVTVSEGVEILAISFPKINAALKDKVVEIGLDATCKPQYLQHFVPLMDVYICR